MDRTLCAVHLTGVRRLPIVYPCTLCNHHGALTTVVLEIAGEKPLRRELCMKCREWLRVWWWAARKPEVARAT